MPGEMARPAPRLPLGLPEATAAVRSSRPSSGKAGNEQKFTPVWKFIWGIPGKTAERHGRNSPWKLSSNGPMRQVFFLRIVVEMLQCPLSASGSVLPTKLKNRRGRLIVKKILLGTAVSFALLACPALAADMPVKGPVYRVMPPTATWTGFYIGVEGGYGWAETDTTVTTPAGTLFVTGDRFATGHPSGWLLGIAAGADYQTGPWVFGIKGSYDWADIKGDSTTASTLNPVLDVHSHSKQDWLAMVTGRVGYAATPDLLLYVNGGWAWAGIERNSETVVRATGAVVATTSGSETRDGWTIGVGAEHRFMRNASLLLQYNYIDFGTEAIVNNVLTGPTAGTTTGRDQSRTLHILKAGLNYRF